ncbi:hypothetical protein F2Q68_00012462, partial [Brassica cretica]
MLEILSKIRHPHLVLLLGACPERGCLVYEYMESGSLDDRLMQVNDTPAMPWFERFRIAFEIASALVFLHKSKPRPIIHRDLKPGNILLDHNFVSKLEDIGLSTMVNLEDASSKLTVLKETSLVGTLCYIDPEYQRTGIISPKSDVYSLGIVILQLITAKSPIGITQKVEETIVDDAEFMALWDVKAGTWPMSETRELAALGLFSQNSVGRTPSGPPSHFICPLLKRVMNEPCVAADGYTYDREAIQDWLRENDTSPVTNLPLPDKNILANYTLYSAIMEWKSTRPELVKDDPSDNVQVHPNQMDAWGKDKDACETVRMNVELVGGDELRYGQFGRLVVVPAEALIGTHAGRLSQSDRYGRMNEPRSNCSERPDLHACWLQQTDPRTRAHQYLYPGVSFLDHQILAAEVQEMGDGALIVAVAIKGNNSKTKGVVRWALQQFASQEHVVFKLLHVQPRDSISVSTARKDSTTTVYKKDVDRKTREMLLPSRDMFAHREVQMDIMVLESDDVADAISKAVQDHGI